MPRAMGSVTTSRERGGDGRASGVSSAVLGFMLDQAERSLRPEGEDVFTGLVAGRLVANANACEIARLGQGEERHAATGFAYPKGRALKDREGPEEGGEPRALVLGWGRRRSRRSLDRGRDWCGVARRDRWLDAEERGAGPASFCEREGPLVLAKTRGEGIGRCSGARTEKGADDRASFASDDGHGDECRTGACDRLRGSRRQKAKDRTRSALWHGTRSWVQVHRAISKRRGVFGSDRASRYLILHRHERERNAARWRGLRKLHVLYVSSLDPTTTPRRAVSVSGRWKFSLVIGRLERRAVHLLLWR